MRTGPGGCGSSCFARVNVSEIRIDGLSLEPNFLGASYPPLSPVWSDASMQKNTKRKLAAGAVAALAVAGGGAAIGATQFNSPKQESEAVINDAASQLGVDPSKLTDALKKGLENRVDAAVAAGQLTKAQGDALKAKIESGNNVPLILPGVGRGFGGVGGPGLRFGFGAGPAFKAF